MQRTQQRANRDIGLNAPMRAAEQRSRAGGSRRGLSEASPFFREAEFRSPPGVASSAGKPEGPANLGPPSLGYFSWRRKKSDRLPGRPRRR